MDKLKIVYIRAFRNLSLIAAAVTTAIIMFADKILFFWLGADYATHSTEVLVVLALTNYFVALYVPLQSILLGLGKMKFLIRQSLFMAGINLILLLILVPRFGILGAAWAYLLSVLPMVYAFYWVERNLFVIKENRLKNYLRLYAKLIFTAIVDGLIINYIFLPFVKNIWGLIVIGPLSVFLYFVIYFALRFIDKEDEIVFFSFIKKFLRLKQA
jgi:O-antigen/teichoic acid export membrane protein